MDPAPRIVEQLHGERREEPITGRVGAGGPIVYHRTRKVAVSAAQLRERQIVVGAERSPFTDAFKILRTQVLQKLREINGNAIAITSPGEGDGKTVTAINLCINLAMELDYTVLLVDANLRNPTVSDLLGMPPGPGLSDYLLDHTPIEQILVHPGIGDFVVLPGGRPLSNSAELLSSQVMGDLVKELKQRYPRRIVVFDLPPVLNAADVLAFTPYVDATLLVVAENRTRREDIARATELLAGAKLMGVALTQSREAMAPKPARPGWFRRLFRRRAAA